MAATVEGIPPRVGIGSPQCLIDVPYFTPGESVGCKMAPGGGGGLAALRPSILDISKTGGGTGVGTGGKFPTVGVAFYGRFGCPFQIPRNDPCYLSRAAAITGRAHPRSLTAQENQSWTDANQRLPAPGIFVSPK